MRSPKGAHVVALAAIAVVAASLAVSYLLTVGEADAQQSRTCAMDPVQQSICIYQAILADVAKSYTTRGGGGISSIVQTLDDDVHRADRAGRPQGSPELHGQDRLGRQRRDRQQDAKHAKLLTSGFRNVDRCTARDGTCNSADVRRGTLHATRARVTDVTDATPGTR